MADKDLNKDEESRDAAAQDRRAFLKGVASISIASAFGAVPLAVAEQKKLAKGKVATKSKGRGQFSTVDPNEKERGATDLGDLENFWQVISDNDDQILVNHMRAVENELLKSDKSWGKAERNFGQLVRQAGIKTIPNNLLNKVQFKNVPNSIKAAVDAKKKGYHWHSHYNSNYNYTAHSNYNDHSNTW